MDTLQTTTEEKKEEQEGFVDGQPDISKIFEAHYQAEKTLLDSLTEERRKAIIKELGYE